MSEPQPPPPFQALASRVVWSCPWYSVRQDALRLPNGEPGVYNVVQKGAAVWIVPVTAAGEVVLVRHYRYTVDDWCWEVPAGGVKAGASPEETAVAELREEIGGAAAAYEYIGPFYPANGYADEVGHIYLASGVTLGPPAHEAAEVMAIHPLPVAVVLQMARRNQISDGPSALALLLCEARLRALE